MLLRLQSQFSCVDASWCQKTLTSGLKTWKNRIPNISPTCFWGYNLQYRVWLHLGVRDCSVLLLSNCDLELWSQLYKNRVLSISSILYDIELTNLICGWIYWPLCATYCLLALWPWPLATVLDRSSQDNICILCEVEIQNLVCGYILGLLSFTYCFWVTLVLAFGLDFRKNEEKVCPELSNNFSTNVLHSSRSCEISFLL